MASDKTFTNADDQRLIELIQQCRRRLVYAAPGISDKVSKALVKRIAETDAPAQIVVILDPDAEVCRLGYGTIEGLETVVKALKRKDLQLHTAPGLRLGLLICNEQTLVSSPVALCIESGSNQNSKPNAILLQPDAPAAIAAACGLGGGTRREIGLDYVKPEELKDLKDNLEKNPPKTVDIARLERVYNNHIQFVEFKVEGFLLGRRTIQVEPEWLGIQDKELARRLQSTLTLFGSQDSISVDLPYFNEDGTVIKGLTRVYNEIDIQNEIQIIRKELISLGHYGSVILKKKIPKFMQKTARFEHVLKAYENEVQTALYDRLIDIRAQLMKDLLPSAIEAGTGMDHSLSFFQSEEEIIEDQLNMKLDRVIYKVMADFAPKMTLVFKDVTYSMIAGDKQFQQLVDDRLKDNHILVEEHYAAPASVLPKKNQTPH